MQIKTVKVSNVSLGASERDIKEFFSFSGDIEYVEMRRLVYESFQLFPPSLSLSLLFGFIFIWTTNPTKCLCSDNERSQIAYVTFKDSQGAETAVLLSVISLMSICYITVLGLHPPFFLWF